jgi:biotin carboxylase
VFERIAVIDPGGAVTRCVQAIQTMGTVRAPPRTVLLHRGSRVPGTLSRGVDEVTLVRGRGRDLSFGQGPALDATVVGAWLERADVDAVWVGWGAPWEHLAIATACEVAGVTFVGPSAAALRALADPGAFTARMDVAGVRIASEADRSSPRSIVEVQLLVDREGQVWTVGRVVHTLDDEGRRLFSNGVGGILGPQQAFSCQQMAIAAVRGMDLHGTVAVELTPPRPDAGPRVRDIRPHLTPTHVLAELTTGLDLVACQLDLAAGSHLTGAPRRAQGLSPAQRSGWRSSPSTAPRPPWWSGSTHRSFPGSVATGRRRKATSSPLSPGPSS